MADGEKFNWRLTAVWWSFLFVAAMCLMIVTATRKTIVIADSSHGEETAGDNRPAARQALILEENQSEKGLFVIPLEKNTKAGNVVVENSYLDRELRIFVGGADESFYVTHAVQGDIGSIVQADRETQQGGVLLRFQMNSVYEFQTSMEGDTLKINVNKPKDLYSMVVVVDPVKGGQPVTEEGESHSEELTLAVSRFLSEYWDMETVKLYITRTKERESTGEECKALVDAVEADIYIRLDVTQDEDGTQYGIRGRYNDEYFIPYFGNVELADILTRNVTITAGNRAVGLVGAEQDSVLYKLQIPAASIELGYLSNVQESELLTQESYRQKLATGILEAIREVYTSYYEQDVQ